MSRPVVRTLGVRRMADVWQEMKSFTAERSPATADELWLVEHPAVFTLGTNADPTNVIAPGDIEVLKIDRGGQVTYHGPGQLVCYVLLDLRRRGFDIRRLVVTLEEAVIASVAEYGVAAYGRRDAPGVYVGGQKFAALGLRVSRGCSYHGLAVNVAMDLEPFGRINPCGLEGIGVTQLSELTPIRSIAEYQPRLEAELLERLASP